MRQFYFIHVTDVFSSITFVQPVRKVVIVTSRSLAMRIAGSATLFYVPSNQALYFDFQSGNTGKGVTSLEFKSFSVDTGADVYVSVSEYGSDGDNDWFK